MNFEHPLLAFFYVTGGPNPYDPEIHSPPELSVSLGEKTKRGCPDCGNHNIALVSDYAGARATLSGTEATWFPECIRAPRFMVVSERVRNDLEENDIRGYVAHRVRVSPGFDFALRGKPIPPYYLLEITGRFEVDRRRFDNFEGQLCPNCHLWKPTKGGKCGYGSKNLFPLLESWNEGDFLLQGNIDSGAMYCTRKVAELARAKKWTGFGISIMSWGCPRGGLADLGSPDWYEDLRQSVLGSFPFVDGEVHSPFDELRKKQQEGIAWPYPLPQE